MRYLVSLFSTVLLLGAVSACTYSDSPPAAAPAPAPTIVNVQAPASDGGLSVLLTLALVGAFVGLIAAVVMGALWMHERGARRTTEGQRADAEDLVIELTGLPMSRARVALARGSDAPMRVGDLPPVLEREERKALRP